MIKFALVGRGWRADYYKNIAALLPRVFEITDEIDGTEAWDVDFAVLAAKGAEFAVVSVKADVLPELSAHIIKQGVPVLSETPAALDLEALGKLEAALAGVPQGREMYQLAENYPYRPDVAARIECIRQGLIGDPCVATVSYTNTYHAIAIMRKLLHLDAATVRAFGGVENVEVTTTKFPVLGQAVYSREGAPTKREVTITTETMSVLRFPDVDGVPKTAVYNFEDNQHRAYDRTRVIEIKGEHGTIHNETLYRQIDYKTPVESHILRRNIGEYDNVEGTGLYAMIAPAANPKYVWQNPFLEASLSEYNQMNCRLNDDELAVATLVKKMSEYVASGYDETLAPYPFEEAKIDIELWAKL
ncbi:MAG: hypothetical protein LBN08_05460 [Lactobacillales bacterium]|jgi:predicted dehydrogenase|nr:hypothetical protein [Lactobacillales bacterium]